MSTHLRRGPLAFREAFELLCVSGDETPAEMKRAYRRAVVKHPPDRDPEGFRRVRAAWELLSHPERAWAMAIEPDADVPLPRWVPPSPPPDARELPLAVLRDMVGAFSSTDLLGDDDGR
ncbi:MAG TPA: J domain-containing protein [Sandaracinaceae bacterium LLY-WYZ-13_1]|nr:J domain-containing protein [Sandaracinaceae bacterium LLY-WYZ-13_1]